MLIALDIDHTLIDTTPSFTRVVKELTGASDEDIALFKATGAYNDDWELIRAFIAWRDAGRPEGVVQAGVVRDVHALLAHPLVGARFDPGDMSATASALYRSGYWRDERILVESSLLHALAARHRVVACTGRDAWEFERAQEVLGFRFADATTMEHAKKPDPRALLRLVPRAHHAEHSRIVLVGDSEADRLCAEAARRIHTDDVRFLRVSPTEPAHKLLQEFLHTDLV